MGVLDHEPADGRYGDYGQQEADDPQDQAKVHAGPGPGGPWGHHLMCGRRRHWYLGPGGGHGWQGPTVVAAYDADVKVRGLVSAAVLTCGFLSWLVHTRPSSVGFRRQAINRFRGQNNG
jgi:hypothetical protein